MMNLFFDLQFCSILGVTALTLLVTGLMAQAETPTEKIVRKESSNLQQQSDFASEIAQTEIKIEPGTATRSGSSYLGLGANIGLDGDTSLGESAVAVISKIGLNNYLSFRPLALIEEDLTFLLSLTVDFWGKQVPEADLRIAPYLGGGLSIATGEDDTVGLLISGGLDIPLSPKFTANTAINVKFIDNTGVGLLLGVGYNF